MKRVTIGVLLVLHGLAHAAAGIWASSMGRPWLSTGLWGAATVSFLAAGFGMLGVPRLGARWRVLTLNGVIASLLLLAIYRHPLLSTGILIDLALLAAALRLPITAPPPRAAPGRLRRALSRTGHALAWGALIYTAIVVGARPWLTTWGTTRVERAARVPGDWLGPRAHYRIDHAVTINARADAIWPWLIQIGQDRAGFYGYDPLEHLFGGDIHNADRIVPEWQHREIGEIVRGEQLVYLGGLLGREPGWPIVAIEPNRYLVLDNWGAFVLEPIDSTTTRLLARSRGEGYPTPLSIVVAPIGLFVVEPTHFVMQRAMLLGIKERAERGIP